MPNIYNYLNYREYLEDFYNERKKEDSTFSYQVFADRAGFKSKSFIKLVIDGRKNLSKDSIAKINRALKLKDKSFSYFYDIIAFNHANKLSERNKYFQRLSRYNQRNKAKMVLTQQYDFYQKWYHNTIRELVAQVDFKEDYAKLGKMVKPPISARKARHSVELLQKLGLIKKVGTKYVQTDTIITTGNEVRSLAVQNFHVQNMMLAAESIDTVPRSQRDISCLVVGLSSEGMQEYKQEIQKFRKKLLEIAEKEKKIDRVYHVNFQFYPMSEVIDEAGE